MLRVVFLFLFTCVVSLSFGQAPIGSWSYYGSYNKMQTLAIVGNKTYIGNDKGSFFVRTGNETKKLTKLDGFADSRVSYLEYSALENILVIAYVNGQIDLLKGNQILNVNAIFRNETINTSKRINHINIIGQNAFLSTDFGIVVLNITTGLIKETYRYIGVGGAQINVFSSTIKQATDSLFIVSEEGLQTASLAGYNLQDFNNWTTHTATNQLPTATLVDVATLADTVYLTDNNGLYALENNKWENKKATIAPIQSLTQGEGNMTLCYADTVVKVSSSVQFTTTTSISQSNQARIDGNGQVQIADGQVGLVVDNTSYFPNGPRYQNAFRINYNNDRITVLSGGYSINGTAKNSTEGYFDYSDLQWTNFQSEFPTVTDLVSSAHNSTTNLSYYASYGDGLLMRNGTSYTLFNSSNSPLNQASSGKVYVTDIQIDEAGNTWLTNYTPNPSDFQKSLFKIDTDGQWTGYEISHSTGRSALSFVIDKDDVKWMVVKQGSTNSILAYNPETGHRKQLTKSLSALPGSVNCLDTDKKGNIYIGTDNGLAQISNPSSVFTANPFTVYVPILGNQQLLKGKHIHAIKIDGGGRLWVGTNNGLFLFNEELSEQIALFTTKNSPLLSNKITAIEIDGETGEVFVSTIEGIFSYMGFATEATDKNKDEIVIFPNPVRPNYHGYVAIRGLVSDANVKITDINTNLVHETNAEGGTATWDMRLLSGERATTGVYLVFTSDEEGEETFVGKIAVISE